MSLFAYALKSFRHNLGLGLIFLITLAIGLCGSVLNISTSMQTSIYKNVIEQNGTAQAMYMYVSESQCATLSADPRVKQSELMLYMREFGVIPGSNDYITLVSSSDFTESNGHYLQWGHSPKEENQIVLAPHTAEALGLKGEMGEEFTLKTMLPDGSEEEMKLSLCGMLAEQKSYRAFGRHNGFLSPAYTEAKGKFGEEYGDQAILENELDTSLLLVQFKPGVDQYTAAYELGESAGVLKDDIGINETLSQASFSDPSIRATAIVAICILLATGIVAISSAFSIIVVRRSRQLRQLSLIGATKSQLVQCVLWEGLFAAVTALPLGLLFSTAITIVGMPTFAALFGQVISVEFTPYLWVYLLTSAVAIFMVLMGALLPALRASKIDGTIQLKSKLKPADDKIMLDLSGLAKINLKQNRSGAREIVAVLVICGILFIGVATIGFSMLGSVDKMIRSTIAGDIAVTTGIKRGYAYVYPSEDQLSPSLYKEIASIPGVNYTKSYRSQEYCYKYVTDTEGGGEFSEEQGAIVGLDKASFAELLKEYSPKGLNEESFKQPGTALAFNQPNCKYAAPYHIKPGQTEGFHLQKAPFDIAEDTMSLNVLAVVDDTLVMPLPFGATGNLPLLVMPEESYLALGLSPELDGVSLYIDDGANDDIVSSLEKITQDNEEIYFDSYYNKFGQESRTASPAFFPFRA